MGLQNGTALYGQTAFTAAALLHQYRQYLQDAAVIQIHHSQFKLCTHLEKQLNEVSFDIWKNYIYFTRQNFATRFFFFKVFYVTSTHFSCLFS